LEDAVATAEGAQLLRNAVHALLDALSKGPTQLSASTLNLMGISSGSFRGDIDAWRLVEVSQAFLDLLDGKITDEARSTAFMPGCREHPRAR
jgi:hypothetical protein